MADEWTSCADCGFGCLKSQLSKTKGKCPRCNPDEASNHISRVKHFKNGGKKADLPANIQ